MTDQRHPTLDYASRAAAEPKDPLSFRIACWFGGIAFFVVLLVPPTGGSSITHRNPIAALVAIASWVSSIVYVWLRLAEERPKRTIPLIFLIGLCATITLIAFPMQIHAWQGDPGHPQPTFRLALCTRGLVGTVALLVASAAFALGRLVAAGRRVAAADQTGEPGVGRSPAESRTPRGTP